MGFDLESLIDSGFHTKQLGLGGVTVKLGAILGYFWTTTLKNEIYSSNLYFGSWV